MILQSQLSAILLFFTKGFFILFILFFALNFKTIKKEFKEIKKKTWIILLLIVAVSFFLRFFWIPHEHYVIDDGFNDLNIAYTIQEHNTHAMCYFVSDDSCKKFFYTTFWPPGYHLALSKVFNIFEPSQEVAFNFSAFLGTLSVFLAFLLGYLWSKREDVALIGSFAFSITPIILKFSGTVSPSFFSLFVILLAFIFFEIFLKNKRLELFFLFLITLLYTVYSRPYNVFLIPVFLFLFAMRENFFEFIKNNKKSFLLSGFLLTISTIPIFVLIYTNSVIYPQEGWSPSLTKTMIYFKEHSLINLQFFINYKINSVVFIFIAFLGMILTFLKEKRTFLPFFIFFTGFFIIYAFYHHGIFKGVDLVKHSLILYIPLFFFFIKGVYYLFSFVDNKNTKNKKIVSVFLIIILIISFLPANSFIFKRNPSIAVFELVNSVKEKIPDDAYVISQNPSLFYSVTRKNTTNYHNFVNNNHYFNDKEVFLIKDHWWYYEEYNSSKYINIIKDRYDFELIESIFSNNRGIDYRIYKLQNIDTEHHQD